MENKVYKPIIKKFLECDVRVIQVDKRNEYIVCKDVFDTLGLVDDDGTWTRHKNKMIEFLNGIDEIADVQSLDVRFKKRETKRKCVEHTITLKKYFS